MKVMVAAILLAIFFSACCPEIQEVEKTKIVYRDTLLTGPPIEGSGVSVDPEYWDLINAELFRLYSENDSLKGLPPDTVKIKEAISGKTFKGKWEIFKVTPSGDSVWVTFRLKNAEGKFDYRVVAAPIKAKLTDTETTKIQEKQPAWYEKIWSDFKDVILVGLLVLVALGWAWDRFRLR